MNLPTMSTHLPPSFAASDEGAFLNILHELGFRLTQIDPTTCAFIQFALCQKEWVLDLGCGFGIAALPIVMNNGYVIANDLEAQHLESIKKKIPPQHNDHLQLSQAIFPQELHLEENSVAAILISRLLYFFSASKIERSLAYAFKWLKPGGKLFIGYEAIKEHDFIVHTLSKAGFLVMSDTLYAVEEGIVAQKPTK